MDVKHASKPFLNRSAPVVKLVAVILRSTLLLPSAMFVRSWQRCTSPRLHVLPGSPKHWMKRKPETPKPRLGPEEIPGPKSRTSGPCSLTLVSNSRPYSRLESRNLRLPEPQISQTGALSIFNTSSDLNDTANGFDLRVFVFGLYWASRYLANNP